MRAVRECHPPAARPGQANRHEITSPHPEGQDGGESAFDGALPRSEHGAPLSAVFGAFLATPILIIGLVVSKHFLPEEEIEVG